MKKKKKYNLVCVDFCAKIYFGGKKIIFAAAVKKKKIIFRKIRERANVRFASFVKNFY